MLLFTVVYISKNIVITNLNVYPSHFIAVNFNTDREFNRSWNILSNVAELSFIVYEVNRC